MAAQPCCSAHSPPDHTTSPCLPHRLERTAPPSQPTHRQADGWGEPLRFAGSATTTTGMVSVAFYDFAPSQVTRQLKAKYVEAIKAALPGAGACPVVGAAGKWPAVAACVAQHLRGQQPSAAALAPCTKALPSPCAPDAGASVDFTTHIVGGSWKSAAGGAAAGAQSNASATKSAPLEVPHPPLPLPCPAQLSRPPDPPLRLRSLNLQRASLTPKRPSL